jgi:sigma-B regulation protein RsbU (phosphoserine phosphatase)
MFRSITTRLIAWTLALTGAVFILTIALSNREGRRTATAAAEREAEHVTESTARLVDDVLHAVEESVSALERAISELGPDTDARDRLVQRFSSDNRDTVARYMVATGVPDASSPAWYRDASARGTSGWSEPYRDPDLQDATVITWAIPLRSRGDGIDGAVGASVRLEFLSSVVGDVHLGESGFAAVLSRRGLLVAHSRRDLTQGIHDPLAELSPELRRLVEPLMRRAEAGESAFAAVPVEGRVFRITLRPIARTGWSLATAYAEDELLADVSALQRTQIALGLTGLAILAVAIVILSRRITRPLGALVAGAGRLATGDLEGPLPEATSRDEVGELTVAFRRMRDSLKDYIRNLRETTAAKERLEGELEAARRIQADMLPSPAAGGVRAGYDLSATLVPAAAVGGDLYDHFEQNRRLFFLLGDVSGKGVAAALFMARAKTLFDEVATHEHDPGAVLATLNRSLCRRNEAGMYVTAVCGVLDIDTRKVRFATAGHEPPILVRTGAPPEPLQTDGGRVLGLIEFGDYPSSTITLAAGDALLMYTDGVSEARDPDAGFYGPERLLAVASRHASADAAAITDSLLKDVQAFAGPAPQSDDITILTLKV